MIVRELEQEIDALAEGQPHRNKLKVQLQIKQRHQQLCDFTATIPYAAARAAIGA